MKRSRSARRFVNWSVAGLAALSLGMFAFSLPPDPGAEVIRAMHNQWKGKWYENMAFEQKALFYKDGKVVRSEVWQELLNSPGNLHIRFNGFGSGNGAIYSRDSVYQFKGGVLQTKRPDVNFLALLGFDVYFYEPEATLSRLKGLGFDLGKSYRTSFKGRDVVVVGAAGPDDRSSSQFWVDSERMMVLRAVKNTGNAVRDVHFNRYRQIHGNWVATEMVFTDGSDTVFSEEYYNISFPKKVTGAIFDPACFAGARW